MQCNTAIFHINLCWLITDSFSFNICSRDAPNVVWSFWPNTETSVQLFSCSQSQIVVTVKLSCMLYHVWFISADVTCDCTLHDIVILQILYTVLELFSTFKLKAHQTTFLHYFTQFTEFVTQHMFVNICLPELHSGSHNSTIRPDAIQRTRTIRLGKLAGI